MDICAFWNSRAGLGEAAGSRDIIAKQLEIEAIASYVRDGMRVLDAGCGNGLTAIELARRYDIEVIGVDFASAMIAAAEGMLEGQRLKGSVSFGLGDVRSLGQFRGFDLIYTERVLINLTDWQAQKDAIAAIGDALGERGLYIMCENSQDGLDHMNGLRECVGLSRITPPWHNRYLRDAEIEQAKFPALSLEGIDYFSSTYYFLSRVVTAWQAAQNGREPDYDDPINQLALQLPRFGRFGQGRIWLWRKTSD
ncbi:MAG TPA: methyltransferase domain-containing protein [Candidatus Binatia bacterium]|jgi:SAM-dependent methyltransferase|nr:methyltransferase domain-containing protein [Candidatus Binatia bacterium]